MNMERGIRYLDAVYGLSFGGGMVIHMLSAGKMTADKAIIDAWDRWERSKSI